MKKVLVITYYWPPSGGAGVQRWLKFVKYLPNYNYKPIVYTVENGEYPVIDDSLNKDVSTQTKILKTLAEIATQKVQNDTARQITKNNPQNCTDQHKANHIKPDQNTKNENDAI